MADFFTGVAGSDDEVLATLATLGVLPATTGVAAATSTDSVFLTDDDALDIFLVVLVILYHNTIYLSSLTH